MKFYLTITPWAFLQPKKKESISLLEDQGGWVENPYPIISGVEMKLVDPWETATLLGRRLLSWSKIPTCLVSKFIPGWEKLTCSMIPRDSLYNLIEVSY